MRGYGSSVKYIRDRYREMHGSEWKGSDFHLETLRRELPTLASVLDSMAANDTDELPDDMRYRPLGRVSNEELLAEVRKRRETNWIKLRGL